MDTRRPACRVVDLPGGGFYVQACHRPADVYPRGCVPPPTGQRATDAVDAGSDDGEGTPDVAARSGSALLDALDAIDSDDEDGGSAPTSSLLDALDAIDSDDDELPGVQRIAPVLVGRTRTPISGAALDLCPTVYHTDTDDSSSSEEEADDSENEESEDESDDEHQVVRRTAFRSAPRLASPSWESDDLSVEQVDRIIRSNMAEIEAKKPWRFVYRCLNVPFIFKRNEDPFDVFFMRWDEFWRAHGRAVWERGFWQPLLPGSIEYYRRKNRQARAQRAFRELATELSERLGKRYRRWLAKALREGWWYRSEPFALRRLFLRDRSLYAEYLVRRAKVRWPRGKKFLLARGLKPLWWLSESSNSDDDL
jgi:hypothetical protein